MIVNIAGYKFININNTEEMKDKFLEKCLDLGLKGTIYFSNNGINFFVAGTQEMIDKYIHFMELDERLVEISLKISYTEYQPFRRMIVKKKKEIILRNMNKQEGKRKLDFGNTEQSKKNQDKLESFFSKMRLSFD